MSLATVNTEQANCGGMSVNAPIDLEGNFDEEYYSYKYFYLFFCLAIQNTALPSYPAILLSVISQIHDRNQSILLAAFAFKFISMDLTELVVDT